MRALSFKCKIQVGSALPKLFISEQIVIQKKREKKKEGEILCLMMLSGCTITVMFEGVTSKGSPYLVTSGASHVLCSISVKGKLWPIYSTVLVTCPTSVKEAL